MRSTAACVPGVASKAGAGALPPLPATPLEDVVPPELEPEVLVEAVDVLLPVAPGAVEPEAAEAPPSPSDPVPPPPPPIVGLAGAAQAVKARLSERTRARWSDRAEVLPKDRDEERAGCMSLDLAAPPTARSYTTVSACSSSPLGGAPRVLERDGAVEDQGSSALSSFR